MRISGNSLSLIKMRGLLRLIDHHHHHHRLNVRMVHMHDVCSEAHINTHAGPRQASKASIRSRKSHVSFIAPNHFNALEKCSRKSFQYVSNAVVVFFFVCRFSSAHPNSLHQKSLILIAFRLARTCGPLV